MVVTLMLRFGKLFNNATEDNLITNMTIGLFNFKDLKVNQVKCFIYRYKRWLEYEANW